MNNGRLFDMVLLSIKHKHVHPRGICGEEHARVAHFWMDGRQLAQEVREHGLVEGSAPCALAILHLIVAPQPKDQSTSLAIRVRNSRPLFLHPFTICPRPKWKCYA